MKIYIGLISSSPELVTEFAAAKEALIPKPIREKLPARCEFKFDAFSPGHSRGGFTVDQHVLEASRNHDYVACLIDQDATYSCNNLRHAVLSAEIDASEVAAGNVRNFLASRLTRLFKSAIFTMEQMGAAEAEQAMRLPRRNFAAAELVELCRLYREDALDSGFQNAVKQQISGVMKRRRPRRRSCYPTKYFVDDHQRYFAFGKELHEILPTGDPHVSHCELNGTFRFGRRISSNRHFNVSLGDADQTRVSGIFLNCHEDQIIPERGQTHLNMFSNDHC